MCVYLWMCDVPGVQYDDVRPVIIDELTHHLSRGMRHNEVLRREKVRKRA
jgi:hypothetical protein